MSTEVLLVQLLVLAFTGALWWIARRDIAARPAPPPVSPDTAELEQLCATLETLVTNLARRLDAIERQPAVRLPIPETLHEPAIVPDTLPEPIASAEPLPDPRYAPVYELLEAGVSDPVEIARQTGLGRGEVDLILSLRSRRAF